MKGLRDFRLLLCLCASWCSTTRYARASKRTKERKKERKKERERKMKDVMMMMAPQRTTSGIVESSKCTGNCGYGDDNAAEMESDAVGHTAHSSSLRKKW